MVSKYMAKGQAVQGKLLLALNQSEGGDLLQQAGNRRWCEQLAMVWRI